MYFCYIITCLYQSSNLYIITQAIITSELNKNSPIVQAAIDLFPFLQLYKRRGNILFPEFEKLIRYWIELNKSKLNSDRMMIEKVNSDSESIPSSSTSPESSVLVAHPPIVQAYINYLQTDIHNDPDQIDFVPSHYDRLQIEDYAQPNQLSRNNQLQTEGYEPSNQHVSRREHPTYYKVICTIEGIIVVTLMGALITLPNRDVYYTNTELSSDLLIAYKNLMFFLFGQWGNGRYYQ
jgi:hypothetical protein